MHFSVLCLETGRANTTGATSGAGNAYPSGAPWFTPGFKWGSCYSIFSFICMFSRSLFVLLYFFFWLLCCLFFNIRFLITPLVTSNSSCELQKIVSALNIVEGWYFVIVNHFEKVLLNSFLFFKGKVWNLGFFMGR